MRKGQSVNMIVTLLVFLVIGISAFVATLDSLVSDSTTVNTATNESITITNGTSQTTANTGVQTGSDTITTDSGNFTLVRDTNYTIDYADQSSVATVTFTNVDNTAIGTDAGLISYDHVASSYLTNTGARTVTGVLPELGALVVLVLAVAVMGFI